MAVEVSDVYGQRGSRRILVGTILLRIWHAVAVIESIKEARNAPRWRWARKAGGRHRHKGKRCGSSQIALELTTARRAPPLDRSCIWIGVHRLDHAHDGGSQSAGLDYCGTGRRNESERIASFRCLLPASGTDCTFGRPVRKGSEIVRRFVAALYALRRCLLLR